MNSVVLLSGGMDSTVNLYLAKKQGSVSLALTFNYGQRAVEREISAAQGICKLLGIEHQVLALPFFRELGQSSLVDSSVHLPLHSEISIDDLQVSQKTAKAVWVPNRNGILLNIAAGYAEVRGADTVIPGFNKEEAATFPDNSKAFMEELTRSFAFSTANKVRVKCFTAEMDKTQIVKAGLELGVDWSLIWPCYQSREKWCGQCESCLRAKRAFVNNGVNIEKFMD